MDPNDNTTSTLGDTAPNVVDAVTPSIPADPVATPAPVVGATPTPTVTPSVPPVAPAMPTSTPDVTVPAPVEPVSSPTADVTTVAGDASATPRADTTEETGATV
ncbi:hypothetical protein KKB40_01555 [Patescibacteria group bacterium]|nr:hypothetical protein [Patescibacteria group bacterium]